MLRNEPEQCEDEGKNARDAQADGTSREADVGRTLRLFEQRIADDGEGQP